MGGAILLAATIASIELLRALGLMAAFGDTARAAQRALRIVPRTRVSEWAKERALRLASARLLGASLKSGLLLLLVAAPLLASVAIDHRFPLGVRVSMMDWRTRLWLFGLTCVYALLRRRPVNGERILQRVALGSRAVLDTSFTIERRLYPMRPDEPEAGPPLFIAGLARAGTSILTRLLHETGDFASLTYRDLPFPLAPNSWARMSRDADRHVATRERGHGDGLTHDLDSPEAIEELFWLCQEGDRYRLKDGLLPIPPVPETIEAFRDYARLVRHRYGKRRYLSKNNNNILRLPALIEAFPDALLVHPFRDPVEQSASLLGQHLRACAMAVKDPYRRHFMRWLGHHEFGADHRPFLLWDGEAGTDTGNLDYWLRRWIAAYAFLLSQPDAVRDRQIFVDYDALCATSAAGAGDLAHRLMLDHPLDASALRPVVHYAGHHASRTIVTEARGLHAALVQKSRDEAWDPFLVAAVGEHPLSMPQKRAEGERR